MNYIWIDKGVLGFGEDAVREGDVLPEEFKDRIKEFLKDKKIKEFPAAKPKKEKRNEKKKNGV